MLSSMRSRFRAFAGDRAGATVVEYGLIAGLIAISVAAATTNLGDSLITMFTKVKTTIDGAGGN